MDACKENGAPAGGGPNGLKWEEKKDDASANGKSEISDNNDIMRLIDL